MPDLPSERYSDLYLIQSVYHTVSKQYYFQMLCVSLKTKQNKETSRITIYWAHLYVYARNSSFLNTQDPSFTLMWSQETWAVLFHSYVCVIVIIVNSRHCFFFGLFILAFFIPSPLSYTSHSASIPLSHTIIEEKKSFQVIIKIGCILL